MNGLESAQDTPHLNPVQWIIHMKLDSAQLARHSVISAITTPVGVIFKIEFITAARTSALTCKVSTTIEP
jgi:hypothetical protein